MRLGDFGDGEGGLGGEGDGEEASLSAISLAGGG